VAESHGKFAVLIVGEWRGLRYRRWQWAIAYLTLLYEKTAVGEDGGFFVLNEYRGLVRQFLFL
jgi:hypothetical protein